MDVVIGASLVLTTWGVVGVLLAGWGSLPAVLISKRAKARTPVRHSMWWGLALASLVLLGMSLVIPLSSAQVAIALTLGGGALGVTAFLVQRARAESRNERSRVRVAWRLVVVALVVAQVVLAFAVLGPVTNYDTGLYHLGAIAYAREFPVLPGLANLYGPLGYSTVEFTWAAALSSTPFQSDAFRLINGLLMALVATDLALRLVNSRSRRMPGTWVLLVGVVAIWGPMLAMADFWIVSPTQDAAALMLSVMVISYMSDVISHGRRWVLDASVVLVTGIVLVAVRSTMAVFVLASVVVVLIVAWRRGSQRCSARLLIPPALIAVFTALAMSARDYFLSGWWGYPLSLFAFDVPWRAADPTSLREATLGYHRNPADIEGSIHGFSWLGPWMQRLLQSWEVYLLITLLVAVVVSFALATKSSTTIRWRAVATVTAPSIIAVVFWFLVSPPAFRFAWGPLFLVLIAPLGWIFAALMQSDRPAAKQRVIGIVLPLGSAAILIGASVATVAVRIDWVRITESRVWSLGVNLPYAVAPVPAPPVEEQVLADGVRVLRPLLTDQCWSVYPLCTPTAEPTLRFLDGDLASGFAITQGAAAK